MSNTDTVTQVTEADTVTQTTSSTTVEQSTATTTVVQSGGVTLTGAVSDGDKGDITVSSSGATWTIDNGAVTAAKVAADVATQAELDAHINDTDAAHAASAISVNYGTTVQAGLEAIGATLVNLAAADTAEASARAAADTAEASARAAADTAEATARAAADTTLDSRLDAWDAATDPEQDVNFKTGLNIISPDGQLQGVRLQRTFDERVATGGTYRYAGLETTYNYGAAATPARGTVHAVTAVGDLIESDDATSEMAAVVGALRAAAGVRGNLWVADFGLQGPIATQPDALLGVTQFLNNYYNGSPLGAPSHGLAAVTRPGTGPVLASPWSSASTYANDYGLIVCGFSNGASGSIGWTVGVQVGGNGTKWMAAGERSRIGTGIVVEDWMDRAILVKARHTSSGSSSTPAVEIRRRDNQTTVDLARFTVEDGTTVLAAVKGDGRVKVAAASDAEDALNTTAANLLYQPLDADLTAIAALSSAADKIAYATGAQTWALTDFTSFARTFVAYTSAANAFAGIKQAATDSATGVVELATNAEVSTGTDTARAITAAGAASVYRRLDTAVAAADVDLGGGTDLGEAYVSLTDYSTDDSFRVLAPVDIPYSATNFSTPTQSNSRYLAGYLLSSGAQNAEVVYRLRGPLAAGTWSIRLVHSTNTSNGVYTIATSTDGSSWTDLTTIEGYAGSAVAAVITDATGLTIPAGTVYVRLKMATKNASSSNYYGAFSALTGVRTA